MDGAESRGGFSKFTRRLEDKISLALIIAAGFVVRDLPFLKYGFLYGLDSLGHFWFSWMVENYGYIFPPGISIKYHHGVTGWFTSYAPFFIQHAVQGEASMISAVNLTTLFANLNAAISSLWVLVIYLIVRNRTGDESKALSSAFLTAFWFYFVFYSWMGTYEIFATFLFLTFILLVEKAEEKGTEYTGTQIAGLFLISTIVLTHHLTTFALLLYLTAKFSESGKKVYVGYVTYLCFFTYVSGYLFTSHHIFFGGLYLAKELLLLVPLAAYAAGMTIGAILDLISDPVNKWVKSNSARLSLLLSLLYISTLVAIAFRIPATRVLLKIHYALTSPLAIKYALFLTPIAVIIFYSIPISRKRDVLALSVILCGFAALAAVKGKLILISRVIPFASIFLILISSEFGKDGKRVAAIAIASLLMLYPTIPSYFYSDEMDRPFYPISIDYWKVAEDLPYKVNTSKFCERLLKPILFMNGKYDRNSPYLINESGGEIRVTLGKEVVYSATSDTFRIEYKFYKIFKYIPGVFGSKSGV